LRVLFKKIEEINNHMKTEGDYRPGGLKKLRKSLRVLFNIKLLFKMPKIIKLIHDKFENDFGFTEGIHEDNLNQIIDELQQMSYQHHPITIYSWGLKKDIVADCELIFDVSLFFTKIEDRSRLSNMNGKDLEIQESILRHPRFLELIRLVLSTVDAEQPNRIAFICNYGKHRSVGWVEIMKTHFYQQSDIKHLNLE